MAKQDPVKKIFGKTAKEIFAEKSLGQQDHAKFHSANAFCGIAGPEEMKHYYRLLKVLTDKEVVELINAVGIKFTTSPTEDEREMLEGVLEEADREDFYREYYKIIDSRKK